LANYHVGANIVATVLDNFIIVFNIRGIFILETISMFIHKNNNVFILTEKKIRKNKNMQHLIDVPMFSVFVTNTVKNDPRLNKLINIDDIKRKCEAARHEIHRIGFPSMHANIVIDDISISYKDTSVKNSAGLAISYKKYMVIDIEYISTDTIVHEWAHLWMFNKPKHFKKSVNTVYDSLAGVSINKIKSINYDDVIKYKVLDTSNLDQKNINLYKFLLKYPPESIKILEYWENYFYNIIWTDNNSVGQYRLLNKTFSKKLMSALPRGFRFENTLKTDVMLTSLSNSHINAPTGTLVYVEKYDKLIIGVDQNNRRYEKVIDFADVDKILGTDTYDKIGMILKHNPIGFEKKSKKQLESEILNFLVEYAIQTLEGTISKFTYEKYSLEREKEMVKNWIQQYVFPVYIKVIRNTNILDKIKNNKRKIYDALWVSNPLKPSETSYADMVVIICNKDRLIKHINSKEKDLAGVDLKDVRHIMRELVDWINEYGMSNKHELWSTAIELFFKLPMKYRSMIVKLML